MGLVDSEWKKFANACFGKSKVSSIQYNEMRRAFLSGMLIAKSLMVVISESDEEQAVEMMEMFSNDLKTELESVLLDGFPGTQNVQ